MRVRRLLLLPVVAVGLATICPLEALAAREERETVERLQLLPRLEGVEVLFEGESYVSDDRGRVFLPASSPEQIQVAARVPTQELNKEVRVRQGRWFPDLVLALDVDRSVRFSFTNRNGSPIAPEGLTSMIVKSSVGGLFEYDTAELSESHWLHAQRVVSAQSGLQVTPIEYSIQRVVVRETNVVNVSQQRFDPNQLQHVRVWLLFFPARFIVRDAVFGFPTGSTLVLSFPDGGRLALPLENGRTSVPALPRGEYEVSVEGFGITLSVPLALSRPQEAEITFLSYVDLMAGAVVVLAFLIGLPIIGHFAGRRSHLRVAADDRRPTGDGEFSRG